MFAVCICVFLEWSSEVYTGVAVAPSQGAIIDLCSTMRLKNEEVGSLYSLWKLGLGDLTWSAEGRASIRIAIHRLVKVLATTDLSELRDELEANVQDTRCLRH